MRRFSGFSTLQLLNAAASIALLAACSGIPTSAPRQIASRVGAHSVMSYDSCPAQGQIEYASDGSDSVIDIFAGDFAGQAPCGQIALHFPRGLYVQPATHDLYVANPGAQNVQVFHRGQTSPYNTYPNRYAETLDVTVAKGVTVIALNEGSISTWIVGPNGGTFVGRFPLKNKPEALWITAQKSTVFYDDFNGKVQLSELWSVRCPAGHCGKQTQVAGVSFGFPGGMAVDNTGNLLVVNADLNYLNNALDTFSLPNPQPSTFPLQPGWPMGMAIDKSNQHVFVTDSKANDAAEYIYPGGALVGTVPGDVGGNISGIAVDW